MRHRLWNNLRYDWPLHIVLWLLNGLPDNVFFLRLRGWAARPFFGRCDGDLRLGRNLDIYQPGRIRLGKHIYIAFGCALLAGEVIEIDDEVMFGPYVVVSSSNHTRKNGSFRYGGVEESPVRIGRGSWISAHVTVTAGTTVGKGALIAAGAVVTGAIPDGVLAGGVPARIIKPLDLDTDV